MACPTSPDVGWPSAHRDPKWAFPQLDLVISSPRLEGEKETNDVVVTELLMVGLPLSHLPTPQTFGVMMIKILPRLALHLNPEDFLYCVNVFLIYE